MSDLIKRSKVVGVLEQLDEHSLSGQLYISYAKKKKKNQSTAYDIDKVVEELEKESFTTTDTVCGGIFNAIRLSSAIEIVKRGGVSDDACEWRLCDEEANVYDTSCRNPHILIEGTPKENNYEYCPYCGKKIKVVDK